MLLNDPHKDPNAGEGKILTLQNVNRRTFGKLFVIAVGGKADAEPLYAEKLEIANQGLRNALLVVTETRQCLCLRRGYGKEFWHVRILGRDGTRRTIAGTAPR